MAWNTYLVMYFGTNGISASHIANILESLGFKTTFGSDDFIFSWKSKPSKEEVLDLVDKVILALKDSGAVFNLDTHD